MPSQAQLVQKAEEISKKPGNNICAECPERHPIWASLIKPALPGGELMGVFICHKCYKHHYEMGMKYCDVKSISMATEWSKTEVAVLAKTGNKVVNAIYEARTDDDWDNDRHFVTFDKEEEKEARLAFVRKKYQKRKYFSEPKYHAFMSKLNPAYDNKDQEPTASERPRRRASLTTASTTSTFIIPSTPRVQRRGSVGMYSTTTPEPSQKVMETPRKSTSGDLKSQLAQTPAPSQARNLLGLPSMVTPEIHRTPSRRSLLANQRSSSLRQMVHGDKATRAPSLLGMNGDSNHDRDMMQLPNALQTGGPTPAMDHSQGMGMRKSRSDVNLANLSNHGEDHGSRHRRGSLLGASKPTAPTTNRTGQDCLLSTPGRTERRSMMVKSSSTRSMRSERRTFVDTGPSLLQDTRAVAHSPREASSRGRRTTGETPTRQQQRRNSVGRSSSVRRERRTFVDTSASLLQNTPPREASSRGRRTTGATPARQQQRRNSVGRSSQEPDINWEEHLPSHSRVSSRKQLDSNHGRKSGRDGRHVEPRKSNSKSGLNELRSTSHDKRHSPRSTPNRQVSKGSVSSHSNSDSFSDESNSERRLLERNNSRDSVSNDRRRHSGNSHGDPITKQYSRKDSKQGDSISPRKVSRSKDTREERPSHVWKKQPSFRRSSSTKELQRSLSNDDFDHSDSDSEEKPAHIWKKQASGKASMKVQRTKSADDIDDGRSKERKPNPRALMMKKQASRRSMRRLPSYDMGDRSMKDSSGKSMKDSSGKSMKDSSGKSMKDSSGKKSSSRKHARRSSSSSRKVGRRNSMSTLDKHDCSVDDSGSKSKDATNRYKDLEKCVQRTCSSGTLGLLMGGGIPDDSTLKAYSGQRDRRAGRRPGKLAGKSNDPNGKYTKGLAVINQSNNGVSMKNRSASTGALGLLAMHANPGGKSPDALAGFDKKVQDLLKKKASSKQSNGMDDSSNKNYQVKNFDSEKYQSAMVAQWLVSQTAT